jgi:hypothetical protein
LDSTEVHDTALAVEIVDDAGATTGVSFYVMHPVLSMESRVHNVVGLPGTYDTEQGRKELRVSIPCAREYMLDVLDGRFDAEEPSRTVLKLNERIFRFCMRDHHARELYRGSRVDRAAAIVDDARLPAAFREKRLPQMREQLSSPHVACTQVPAHLPQIRRALPRIWSGGRDLNPRRPPWQLRGSCAVRAFRAPLLGPKVEALTGSSG